MCPSFSCCASTDLRANFGGFEGRALRDGDQLSLGEFRLFFFFFFFFFSGDELKFGRAQIGCRCWLAISGGIDVPVVLGSRSTDLRANFGGIEGRALRDGDVASVVIHIAAGGQATPATENFLVDRTARLGEPGKPPPEFAFHSWRRLEPLRRCNDSTIHESRIQRFTRFRSYGCSP